MTASARATTFPAQRGERIAALGARTFDVLVIGGGITGAGVARDAALRGLSVALLERDDFASGTSSRSSRLVHGGIRYLEHGHLHLVFESSAERRRLVRVAPHLVRPQRFTWPVYRGARVGRWKLAAGLLLYDALALFRNLGAHERLDRGEVVRREPALRRDGLVGGAAYFDAVTDDARLTLANALDASASGAVVLNHVAVAALSRDPAGIRAAGIDRRTGGDVELVARTVVNATGPWSDLVRRLEEPRWQASVRGTKGVHVAVPHERVGNQGAVTLLSPADGRVMFVLPAGQFTIIGTTDTDTVDAPEEVRATQRDVAYLLESANAFFPEAKLGPNDVVSAWAGIRPLASRRVGERPSSASREHAIARGALGMLSVTGGKLTTYRAMAGEIVDAAERSLGRSPAGAPTLERPLPGGDIASLEGGIAEARRRGVPPESARHLVHAYGTGWRDVWALAESDPALRRPLEPTLPYLCAEIVHAVRAEMAETLGDLLIRRTHVAFETRDHGRAAAPVAARIAAPELGWDADRVGRELAAYEREATRIFAIEPDPV